MNSAILAVLLLIGVIVVIIIFLWKTRSRTPSFHEDELEQGERPSYDRVFRCPKCEAQVDWDYPECPECGTVFEDDAFECPRCSAPADPSDLECGRCGLVFLEEAFVCPNCKHAVEPDTTRCGRCKETFWSPLRLPSGRGSDMLKVQKDVDEKKEED